MNNSNSKKKNLRQKPKTVTSSDKSSKRDQLVNEIEKIF